MSDVHDIFTPEFTVQNGGTQSVLDINTTPVIIHQIQDSTKSFRLGLEDWEAILGLPMRGEIRDPNLSQSVVPKTNTAEELNTPTHDSFPVGTETESYLSPPSVEIDTTRDELSTLSPSCFLDTDFGSQTLPYARESLPLEPFDTRNLEAADGGQFLSNDNVRPKRDVKFVPKESTKRRNPPYLLRGDDITTKDKTPVKIEVHGSELKGLNVHVSLRYADPIKKTSPVHACKLHELEEPLPDHFTFYLTEDNQVRDEYKYQAVGVHPTAIVPLRDACTYKDEVVSFCIVFRCLNSCHKHCKLIDLLLTAVDSTTMEVVKQQTYKLRVCKNVKRDHLDMKREMDLKRKVDFPEVDMKVVKREKIEVPVVMNQAIMPPSINPPLPPAATTITTTAPVPQNPTPTPSPHTYLPPTPMPTPTKEYIVVGLQGEDRYLVRSVLKRMGINEVVTLQSLVETPPAPVIPPTAFSHNL